MKLYVGCALTLAPEEFKKSIEELKGALRSEHEVMDFIGTVSGTPHDVYQWDIHECVAKCDIFVAICDFPAIGLGYELSVAVEKLKKPTLATAHKDNKISRMLLGINQPHYKFEWYENSSGLLQTIRTFIAERT